MPCISRLRRLLDSIGNVSITLGCSCLRSGRPCFAQRQFLKFGGQRHMSQTCVKLITPQTALKTAWQSEALAALVEPIPKCQVLKIGWPRHMLQALIELMTKSQVFKTTWLSHVLKFLIESISENQALKIGWEDRMFQALIEVMTEGKL